MNKHNAVILVAVASALGLATTPRSAAAATPASEENILATIVVTAQKRETDAAGRAVFGRGRE